MGFKLRQVVHSGSSSSGKKNATTPMNEGCEKHSRGMFFVGVAILVMTQDIIIKYNTPNKNKRMRTKVKTHKVK